MVTDDGRRRRRRRGRLIAIAAFLVVALALTWILEKQRTTTVFIVRFAELADYSGTNPGLSPAGHARARALARVLRDARGSGGIDAIFATEYRNTQETAEPLAKALGLPVQIIAANNVRGLRDLIRAEYEGRMVLVVTTSAAMARLIYRLDGLDEIPPVARREHDNLYVVSIPWYGKVSTLRLKYGLPYAPLPNGLQDSTPSESSGG